MFKEKEEKSMSKSTITVDEETIKIQPNQSQINGTNQDKIIMQTIT